MKDIKKRIHRKEREIKRGKLSLVEQKRFELNIIELKTLVILKDGLNEIENRFMVESNELNNFNERIRDIRKYNETNPFDFADIRKDEDIDLKQFLDIAEKMWFYTKI